MKPIPIDMFRPGPYERRAMVQVTIEELEEELGLDFAQDIDDLGELRWLPAELPSGKIVVLMKYNDAADGIEVWGAVGLDLAEVARSLGLPESMIEPTIRSGRTDDLQP